MVSPGELDLLLAAADDRTRLADLLAVLDGDRLVELERSVAGPLAFLACRKFVHGADDNGALDSDLAEALLRGVAQQTGMLALLESIDELLASAAFRRQYGTRAQATFLAGHNATRNTHPLVAAAFAEGALRLALNGTVSPLRILVALTSPDVRDLAPEYAERLPRLLGAALDQWGTDRATGPALREALSGLLGTPATAADAAFECGLDALRQAVAGTDPLPGLATARQHFANAEAAEQDRPDAALYGCGIDSVMAFFREDRAALQESSAGVRAGLARRRAARSGSHTPAWRRPRAEAEFAWSRLVAILDRAADMITRPVWIDAWQSLDAVLDAYLLDRTVMPVPGDSDGDGFACLVRPVVESALVRRQTLLAQLRLVTEEPNGQARSEQLAVLRDRIDRLSESPPAPAAPVDIGRLVAVAPSLLAELSVPDAARIADRLDDGMLRLLDGVAYNSRVRRAARREPVTAHLLQGLTSNLLACPDYAGETRHAIDDLLAETVMFLSVRHDLQRSATVTYLHADGPVPVEAMLQDDFADWLRRGPLAGRIAVEVPNIATGRADIVVGFGTTRFVVEVKRELHDGSDAALERSYLVQAADYSGTSATLGILLVLDLTPHPDGVRHLRECAWVAVHRPTGSAYERHVVVAVVPGNRMTPSGYSRTAHVTRGRGRPGV
ncbi:hypothetical protein [Actinoplanes subglobosus]|uniref:Uncharacterized protein n=1 Tax=Actinoplanes subglobosus TaxID=1547892 RepID=A0ABV8J558_9ACTN